MGDLRCTVGILLIACAIFVVGCGESEPRASSPEGIQKAKEQYRETMQDLDCIESGINCD